MISTLFLALACNGDSIDRVPALPAAEPVALLPRGLTSFGAEALDGWMYVLGGYHGEPHRYSREGQSPRFYRVALNDPRQIEELDDVAAIQGSALAAWKGALVSVGGMIARNARGEDADLHSTRDVQRFDPSTRAWTTLPELASPRSSHDVEVQGDSLVVLGGWKLDGSRDGEFATKASVLDLRHPEKGWSEIDAPFRRRALAAVRLGTKIAAVGGMDETGTPSTRVDLLDVETRTWSLAPEFPGEPFGVAAASLGDSIVASGKDGVVWRLDEGSSAWQRAGTLAFPRFFHQIVADGASAAFVLGGIADMRAGTRIRHVERLSFAPRAGPSIARFEIPAPFAAKNRQGMFLRGNVLTVFGGNRSREQHDFEPEDFQDDCYALDLGSFAWTMRGNFPERRQTIATAFSSDGKSGLAIGGFGHDGENAVARSAGFRYSFADDAWKRDEHLDLPLPRTQFGLATIRSTLWLFGGLDYDPTRGDDAFVHPTAVLSLDLASEDAALAASGVEMPGARRAFACGTLGERAYIVGGMRGNFELVEDCVAFDAGTRKFTPIAAPKRTRLSGELVALGQKLYLCGGSSRSGDGKLGPDPTIEEYDPATDRWTVIVDALPAPMGHMRAFALRDRLLLVSANVDGARALRVCLIRP